MRVDLLMFEFVQSLSAGAFLPSKSRHVVLCVKKAVLNRHSVWLQKQLGAKSHPGCNWQRKHKLGSDGAQYQMQRESRGRDKAEVEKADSTNAEWL